MERLKITSYENGEKRAIPDWVTEEVQFTLEVNKKALATFFCSPTDLKELATGFLYTSGFIKGVSSVKNVLIDYKKSKISVEITTKHPLAASRLKRFHPSTLRGLKIPSGFVMEGSKIIELMNSFQVCSSEFNKTGGVHSAALCDREKIIIFKDDVGRHNALDKVIGEAILKEIGLEDKIILTSGRIPLEILLKIIQCNIPLIASVSAPTNQAVELARHVNITLIGFVRGKKMNIYSGEERVSE